MVAPDRSKRSLVIELAQRISGTTGSQIVKWALVVIALAALALTSYFRLKTGREQARVYRRRKREVAERERQRRGGV